MRHKPLTLLALLAAANVAVAACERSAQPTSKATETIALTVAAPTAIPAHKATVAPTATRWRSPTPTRPGEQLPTATAAPTAFPTPDPTPVAFDPSGISPEGPWLVFGHFEGEQLRIVNQDGTGQTPLATSFYDASAPTSITDPSNRVALRKLESTFPLVVFLVRPKEARAIVVYEAEPMLWRENAHEQFRSITFEGDENGGYLTSLFTDTGDGHRELILHRLPTGSIVERLRAIACDECGIGSVKWSWSGRYFAFTGSLDNASQNLYVYDTVLRKLRRLTWQNESVEEISWSPRDQYLAFTITDGGESRHLMIYELADDATRRLTGWLAPVEGIWWSHSESYVLAQVRGGQDEWGYQSQHALWSVGAEDGAARWLYSFSGVDGAWYAPRGWVGADRFLFTIRGPMSNDPELGYPSHLVLVDLAAGEVLPLYHWGYEELSFDPKGLAVAAYVDFGIYETYGYGLPNLDWYLGPGVYVISPSVDSPQLVLEIGSYPGLDWNQALQLFTTVVRCTSPEGTGGVRAFNGNGHLRCVQVPVVPEVFVSPDGGWRVLKEGGIWLQSADGDPVGQVAKDERGQVIWGPDSKGFFLGANNALSYVSVPDLRMSLVDGQIGTPVDYQWLSGDVP